MSARAATTRLKVNPPLGAPPTLEWRAVGELLIDSVYQRSIDTGPSQTLIRRIAMYWDWGLCQPLAVSRRPDGALTIVDGQHRASAAKMRGDIPHLPCVFDGAIWEPACGEGDITRVLEEAGHSVISSDLVDRGFGESRRDFLMEWQPQAPNIVTNPPFKLASEFVEKSLELTTGKVAMFLRLAFLEGVGRGAIFPDQPLARVWVMSRRVPMWRGEIRDEIGSLMAMALMRAAGRPSQISSKRAVAALTMLLEGCTKARLAGFTAQGLAASYNVPLATCERMLGQARQGNLL